MKRFFKYFVLIAILIISSCEDDENKGYGDSNIARIRIKASKVELYQNETIPLSAEIIYGDGSVQEADKPVAWSLENGEGELSAAEGSSITFSGTEVNNVTVKLLMDDYTDRLKLKIMDLK